MIGHKDLIVSKLDWQGQIKLSYPGRVVYADHQVTIVRCSWGDQPDHDLGPFILSADDILIEHYYVDEWFNIFVIYDKQGRLKGWYCNITRPASIDEAAIGWPDLALDLLVTPDEATRVLDRDEFECLPLNTEERSLALHGLSHLQSWVAEGRGPFASLNERS